MSRSKSVSKEPAARGGKKKTVPKRTLAKIAKDGSISAKDPFGEVLRLIQSARQRAYQAVNTELIALYWQWENTSPAKLLPTDGARERLRP